MKRRYASVSSSTGKKPIVAPYSGRHVGDRRAIRERERRHAGAEELDELADDLLLAEHLRHGQHEVRRGHALAQAARELEADHLRDEHRERLPEHRGLGLDPADAPADDAEAVDHRRVRVGADQRVGEGGVVLAAHDAAGQVLEVDLVADAGVGRDDAEVHEGLRAPAQEGVALRVALVLELGVLLDRADGGVLVDLDRVIDDEIRRLERVDLVRVTTEQDDRLAHRGEVDHAGDAREILEQHAPGVEGDLLGRDGLGVPVQHRLDVLAADDAAVLVAEEVLEQNLEGHQELLGGIAAGGEPKDAVRRATDGEGTFGFEAIVHGAPRGGSIRGNRVRCRLLEETASAARAPRTA